MTFVRLLLFACLIASIGATVNSPMSVGYTDNGLFFNIKNSFLYDVSLLNIPLIYMI